MENASWETVLVEWANCLRLAKPVRSMTDLRDGDFFRAILGVLNADVKIEENVVSSLLELFKIQYPDFVFHNDDLHFLSEASSEDLIVITSLLMHHSCITDRREVLTSPLCHRLSQSTQMNIKAFLEKVEHDVTLEKLQEIILECCAINCDTSDSSLVCNASGDSSSTVESPLQGLFVRTPHTRRSRFLEKNREINKLRLELQSERYEKQDLQEEVKAQLERNDKLDKELAQKEKVIKKLRSEIVALECRTPPNFQSQETLQVQRRLRSEIETLEQYISRLEKEQEELVKEKDLACERVKKLETECLSWQGKALTADNACDTLTEKSQQQETEINNLRSYCKELSNMLEELKTRKPSMDSFAEWTAVTSRRSIDAQQSTEDLAHTVVDVQLKDMQKENQQLKRMLSEDMIKITQLSETLEKSVSRYDEINTKFMEMQKINEELYSKTAILGETQNRLKKTEGELAETLVVLKMTEERNQSCFSEIRHLQENIKHTQASLEDMRTLNEDLRNELLGLKENFEHTKLEHEKESTNYRRMQLQSEKLQEKLKEIADTYQKTSFELDAQIRRFKECDAKMTDGLMKLESYVMTSCTMQDSRKFQVTEVGDVCDKKSLNEQLELSENVIMQLHALLADFEGKVRLSLSERDALRADLNHSETTLTSMKGTITVYEEKIGSLSEIIAEMSEKMRQLEGMKAIIKDKERTISEEKENSERIHKELCSVQIQISEYEKSVEQLSKKNKQLENERDYLEMTLTETKDQLNKFIQDNEELTRSLDELKNDKSSLVTELQCVQKKLEEQYAKERCNREAIDSLTQAKEKLTEDIKGKNGEISELQVLIRTKEEDMVMLRYENESITQKLEAISRDLLVHKESEDALKKILEETQQHNNKAVLNLNNEISQLQANIQRLEGELKDITEKEAMTVSELERVKGEKLEVKEEMTKKVVYYEKSVDILNITTSRLEAELKQSNQDLQVLSEKYHQSEEQREQLMCHYQQLKDDVESCRQQLDEKQRHLEEKNVKADSLKAEMDELHEQLGEKDAQVKKLLEDIDKLNAAIDGSRTAYENLEKVSEEKAEKLKRKIKIITETRLKMEKKCEELECECAKLLKNLKTKETEYATLNEQLEKEKKKTHVEIENLTSALNKASLQRDQIILNNKQEVDEQKQQYDKLSEEMALLQQTSEELKHKNTNLAQELKNKDHTIAELKKQHASILLDKEEKISDLHSRLVENNERLQELTADHDSALMEFKTTISDLNDQITDLKCQIDRLNIKEINQLHEIHELKSELSKTLQNYTAVLEEKREMEQETESQIKSLTENLHDIVERYNNLQKVQSEAEMLLKKANERIVSLEDEKSQIEQLFAQEKMKCQELEQELREENTKKMEFVNTIEKLTQQLRMSQKELEDVKSTVNGLECDKNNTDSSLKELKLNYDDLDKKFVTLRDEYNTHIENCESKASSLHATIETLKHEKESATIECADLIHELKQLRTKALNDQKEHEEVLVEKTAKLEELQKLNDNYKHEVARLLQVQEKFEDQCSDWKQKYEESKRWNEQLAKEFEDKITETRCAQEILETGKQILEKECGNLTCQIESLQEKISTQEEKFEKEQAQKDSHIRVLENQLQQLKQELKEKETEVLELQVKFNIVRKAVDESKAKELVLEEGWRKQLENNENKYKQLEKELEEKTKLCSSLQENHSSTSEKLEILKAEKIELQHKLENNSLEKEKLLKLINEYESNIAEKVKEVNYLKDHSQKQENTIAELNSRIDDNLKQLLVLQREKRTLTDELERTKQSRDMVLENQSRIIKETEENVLKAHENSERAKEELLKKIEELEIEKMHEGRVRIELEQLLANEKQCSEILRNNMEKLEGEKSKFIAMCDSFKSAIRRLKNLLETTATESCLDSSQDLDLSSVEDINNTISRIENYILKILEVKQTVDDHIQLLENEKNTAANEIKQLKKQQEILISEKEKLFHDYELLNKEKRLLISAADGSNKSLEDLQAKHDYLQAKYEQMLQYSENNERLQKHNVELQQNVCELLNKQKKICDGFQNFYETSKTFQTEMKRLIAERTYIDQLLTNIRQNLTVLNNSANEVSCRQLSERKENIEIIVDDIFKQSTRVSKRLSDISLSRLGLFENSLSALLNDKEESNKALERESIDEAMEMLGDLKDRAADALQQLIQLNNDYETKRASQLTKPPKEVVRLAPVIVDVKAKEEEWRKKNLMLKQRLTLSDNAKTNLERKIKLLREENKKLTERKADQLSLQDSKLEEELDKVRLAYTTVLSEKSQLQLELATLRRSIESKNAQLGELTKIKEAYEKLLEENSRLVTEVDTVSYKRTRDKEEIASLLQKERDEYVAREAKKVAEVRRDYEVKLEMMKEKMIKLYKEEYNKQMHKFTAEQNENTYLRGLVESLRGELNVTKAKIGNLERQRDREKDKVRLLQSKLGRNDQDMYSSTESLRSLNSRETSSAIHAALPRGPRQPDIRVTIDPKLLKPSTITTMTSSGDVSVQRNVVDERRVSTLPRGMGMEVVEEVTVKRRTSITSLPSDLGQNLKMEDEEDAFNNKYLSDLKEGRCIVDSNEDPANRMTELMFRNSLCPPHLKSCYPAETQFTTPSRFKEDDIKAGILEFDDSSTKLLPGEKHRPKKDVGTTSYKKPGPPTPSKNGGRLSLQGNEGHPRNILHDHNNEAKTPKRTTPSRLKALFMGKNPRDNTENQQPSTPKGRRLSIFRKPR